MDTYCWLLPQPKIKYVIQEENQLTIVVYFIQLVNGIQGVQFIT